MGRFWNLDGRFQCNNSPVCFRAAVSFTCGQGSCPDVPVLACQPFSNQRKSTGTIFGVDLLGALSAECVLRMKIDFDWQLKNSKKYFLFLTI
jgi:hypothetical protein